MIVYIVDTFPSGSEWFIVNEIVSLKKLGLPIRVLAVNKGRYTAERSKWCIEETVYARSLLRSLGAHLYFLVTKTIRYCSVFAKVASKISFLSPVAFLKSIKVFSIGIDFLYQIRKLPADHIHAHFISLPADIAMVMSQIAKLPFSVSAHARDIYTSEPAKIVNLISKVQFVITCTRFNKVLLNNLAGPQLQHKINHIYHGIDSEKWPMKKRSNRYPAEEIRIISVGRLVEKKGIIWLLKAVRRLKLSGKKIHCSIVGDGPLRATLEAFVKSNGLDNEVWFCGELDQRSIRQVLAESDVFVLPCIVAVDGDMDGLPNVLPEALSSGLPVITTSISGITELIRHEITGLLVPCEDDGAIAEAITRLFTDSKLYSTLVKNGREIVERAFSIDASSRKLYDIFKNRRKLHEGEM